MSDTRNKWFPDFSSNGSGDTLTAAGYGAAVGVVAGAGLGAYLGSKATAWSANRDKIALAKKLDAIEKNKFVVEKQGGINTDITTYFAHDKITRGVVDAFNTTEPGLGHSFSALITDQAFPKVISDGTEWLQFIKLWDKGERAITEPTSQSGEVFLIDRFDAYFRSKNNELDKYLG
jgi:hypothetical protein